MVRVTINAQEYGARHLGPSRRGTVSDAALRRGVNSVLIRWKPGSERDTLRFQWRNIGLRPERSFYFG